MRGERLDRVALGVVVQALDQRDDLHVLGERGAQSGEQLVEKLVRHRQHHHVRAAHRLLQ